MPFPNYHTARVKNPNLFKPDTMRTVEITDGITAIMGKLKPDGASMVTQTYRFDKTKFTPAQSKTWLKEHNINPISFEEASE